MAGKEERAIRLKDRILGAPRGICLERARFYTQAYRETEGEHPSIRAAKALDRTLRNMTIYILDEELVVGNKSSKLVGALLPVERGDISYELLIDRGMQDRYRLTGEEKKELFEEIMPYWLGQTVFDLKGALLRENCRIAELADELNLAYAHLPPGVLEKLSSYGENLGTLLHGLSTTLPYLASNVFDVQGHLVLGHKNVIKAGFKGVKESARKKLEGLGEGDGGRKFLEAVMICCDAVEAFAKRFADLAGEMALKEKDGDRKKELEKIAENCRWVPHNPPRNFHEAVQFLWFVQVVAYISQGGAGAIFAMGRVDQYLHPFYEKDIKEGRVTRQEAQALLEELLVKTSCNLIPLFTLGRETASEFGSDEEMITLGGVDREGEDATNELSYMFLDAVKKLGGLCHHVAVRVSKKTPEDFLMKAADVCGATNGIKGFFNDEIIVPNLADTGHPLEDAREYALIGCVEPAVDGNSFPCTSGNDISLVAALEMALKNGRLRSFDRRIGPETGDAGGFTRFDELMGAYKKQLGHLVGFMARCVELKDKIYAERFHNPFVSSTLEGCVEKALDMTQGGARHNFSSISGRGLGTTADSLAAIKKLVFDERVLGMRELMELLDTNFGGREDARQMLIRRAPKYGNDEDYVDSIARDVMGMFCDEVSRHENGVRGGVFRPGAFSYGMHVSDGWFLGATPDGRKVGDPVSNSLSPSTGIESKGPTAVLKSAAKIDHRGIWNGNALNVKLFPSLLETEEGKRKFVALIRAYFEMGGQEVQFNIVDPGVLIDAQKHPEKYRDLVVRVSGYNAYFVELGRSLQDEIIARVTFRG